MRWRWAAAGLLLGAALIVAAAVIESRRPVTAPIGGRAW